jgi:hypothetical protein
VPSQASSCGVDPGDPYMRRDLPVGQQPPQPAYYRLPPHVAAAYQAVSLPIILYIVLVSSLCSIYLTIRTIEHTSLTYC